MATTCAARVCLLNPKPGHDRRQAGHAVIVSIYAAGAVPGAFVPGARAAFLSTAVFTLVSFIVAVVLVRPNRRRGTKSA